MRDGSHLERKHAGEYGIVAYAVLEKDITVRDGSHWKRKHAGEYGIVAYAVLEKDITVRDGSHWKRKHAGEYGIVAYAVLEKDISVLPAIQLLKDKSYCMLVLPVHTHSLFMLMRAGQNEY